MSYADKVKIFSRVYVGFGFLIVLFPPQFKHLSYENKFRFFAFIDKVDFYFFMYEIISYLLIGALIYLFYFKNKQNETSKEHPKIISENGKNELVKAQSVQLLNEAIRSLVINVKCKNTQKAKIVILTIYLNLLSTLELTIQEEKIMQNILNEIIQDADVFEAFIKYSNLYEEHHKQTAMENKDNSQKLYSLAIMHALYLFGDKKESDLLVEIGLITSYYSLVLKVVQMIKI